MLICLLLVSAGMMGSAYPVGGMLHRGSSLFLFVRLAVTIALLVDLDGPARGAVTIEQKPMVDLVAQFAVPKAATDRAAHPAQNERLAR
jgi:uncharacterized membrane protein